MGIIINGYLLIVGKLVVGKLVVGGWWLIVGKLVGRDSIVDC
jgi:hypothetical protein